VEDFGAGGAGEWVSVFRSVTRRPCEEQALVLKAMGVDHRVTERPDGCHVLVPAAEAAAAIEQLRLYRRENPGRPVATWPAVAPSRGVAVGLGFAALVALSFALQARYAFGVDWAETGELVAGRVREGEWWRALTALALHGDAAHAAGNIAFGAFFGYLAGQYLGSGVAALAIVLAAGAGNFANALVQSAGHRSIGASTAVFAALGLVAAYVFGLSRRYALGWARRWAPVVGAVALLAYTGTGDEQTDIVAHLTGFLAGAALGALLVQARAPSPGRAGQLAAGAGSLGVLALAWLLALSR
jgi:membrane associated rhomboid family serine protease